MDQGLLPRRYAKAFYKYALEKDYAKRAYDLMNNLDSSFDQNPSMAQVIANPYVEDSKKVALLITAAGADKDKDLPLNDFYKLLVKNHRLDQIHAIALDYAKLYRKANNIYNVNIESASELDSADADRIKDMIYRHLGDAKVQYTFKVTPDLIGGFVVTIDSERLDASVRNELEQLRLNLLK